MHVYNVKNKCWVADEVGRKALERMTDEEKSNLEYRAMLEARAYEKMQEHNTGAKIELEFSKVSFEKYGKALHEAMEQMQQLWKAAAVGMDFGRTPDMTTAHMDFGSIVADGIFEGVHSTATSVRDAANRAAMDAVREVKIDARALTPEQEKSWAEQVLESIKKEHTLDK